MAPAILGWNLKHQSVISRSNLLNAFYISEWNKFFVLILPNYCTMSSVRSEILLVRFIAANIPRASDSVFAIVAGNKYLQKNDLPSLNLHPILLWYPLSNCWSIINISLYLFLKQSLCFQIRGRVTLTYSNNHSFPHPFSPSRVCDESQTLPSTCKRGICTRQEPWNWLWIYM